MKYKVQDSDEIVDAEIIEKISQDEYRVKIKNSEHIIKILNINSGVMEFVLDNKFHTVRYIENKTSEMKFVIDGSELAVNMNSHLDEIVYKNSGGSETGNVQLNLYSQIPGKVVSINAGEGSEVKKGDVVCVLESMKMQVTVKSHKDGVVKTIKIKEGNSVNKNDIIAEIE
ncbi:MAG: acetyl-CoA carboxylase biotin carboxyl carrier protein subunit [Crenarchaeota archaeon]|nr:acetyl-CoA carboxylase biotin carboxyl carrier protein subunit [Thermoproteota archaeon]MDA1124099.1 acetyl-CoA carboxylase biotin carboxyl carrier protein subunit [Thermoproteota archaeon]